MRGLISYTTIFANLLCVLLLNCTSVTRGQGTLQTIAITGTASPDGVGTLDTFETPVLNEHGDISVLTRIAEEGVLNSRPGVLLYKGGVLSVLARTGQTASDGTSTYQGFQDGSGNLAPGPMATTLNNQGTIISTSQLGIVPGISFNAGVFKYDGEDLTLLWKIDDTVPAGGATFNRWSPFALNNQNQAAVLVDNEFDPNTITLSLERIEPDNTFTQLLAEGKAIPGTEAILTGAATPTINDAGSIALAGIWKTGEEAAKRGILLVDDEGTHMLAQEGDALPDGNGIFGNSFDPPVLNDLGQVAFTADVDESIPSVQFALFLADKESVTVLGRRGGDTPDGLATFTSIRPPSLNNQGLIVFTATTTRKSGAPQGYNGSGIFLGDKNGIQRIIEQGSLAPDGEGGYQADTHRIFLINTRGQIAFVADYQVQFPRENTDRIMLRDTDGTLYQIAREGQEFMGSTIKDVALYGNESSGRERQFGGRSALNESGQVAFWAELEDGRQGIFLWSPPPPEPKIVSVEIEGDTVVLTIVAALNYLHQLQINPALSPNDWENAGSAVLGNGGYLTLEISLDELVDDSLFLRVIRTEAI